MKLRIAVKIIVLDCLLRPRRAGAVLHDVAESALESKVKFVLIPELKGRWIWELRSPEGSLISKSPGSFVSKMHAVDAITAVKRAIFNAGIYDLVGSQVDERASALTSSLRLSERLTARKDSVAGDE